MDGSRVPIASANAPAARRDPVPWAVAAIALVALIAMIAGGRFFGSLPSDPAVAETPAVTRGPDLSRMTPREITDRLFNRVMELHEAGLEDSVKFLALNMAIPAFDLHDSLDVDLRYHLGRIAEVSGALAVAKAQADTILREKSTHLLGLALAARVARLEGDASRARAFDRRLLAAEKSEMALGLREYEDHKFDLDSALAKARRGGS